MGKISHTWGLMRASWGILKQDKEMLLFPVFSTVSMGLVLASFAVPLFLSGGLEVFTDDASGAVRVAAFLLMFLFYFCNYFIIVFFNSAIVACACVRMAGGNPTVGDGFRAAFNRIHLIAGWAVIAATVGMVLRLLEDRSETFGRIVAAILGMAWSAMTFFVIPILVIERRSPTEALRDSVMLLKKTWGEQVIGHFSFGMVFFIAGIPAFVLFFAGILSGNGTVIAVTIVVVVVYMMLLALIQATLQSIFQAALYLYARDGVVPGGFESAGLTDAMVAR